jgi:uncharacterized membrane protein
MLRQTERPLAPDQTKVKEIRTLLEDGLAALLDAGLAFADAVLAVFVVDLVFALVAAAFAAVCTER